MNKLDILSLMLHIKSNDISNYWLQWKNKELVTGFVICFRNDFVLEIGLANYIIYKCVFSFLRQSRRSPICRYVQLERIFFYNAISRTSTMSLCIVRARG